MGLINRLTNIVQRLDHIIPMILGRHPPPDQMCCLATFEGYHAPVPSKQFSVKDFIGDGILWGVPKHRKTIEKRLKNRYGTPGLSSKMIPEKTHLRVCNSCGNHYEVGVLCPTCYENIRKETEIMQEKIKQELKMSPVENEVVVLYDGEKAEQPDEFWRGKRIIEMEKPRPKWFSKNLMQKSTQKPATTAAVKPDELC
ncbi:large ribosomal subunit protein bL32m [Culicoides brevitarsis]|uniref:large ribosomal subunit protein bL32m n=1 Tax=Culicoides brevitarsis TaxID=469753 RepID=UPI00307BE86C